MLNIYVANLGKYNEGKLVGEWTSLPITEEALDTLYKRIGISEEPDENGCIYEEVALYPPPFPAGRITLLPFP